jgi:hypothetical protein
VVAPDDAPSDVARRIELSGFPPGGIGLHATLREADGSLWRSQPTCPADGGDLHLDLAAPESGDWRDPASMAIVRSMRQTEQAPRTPESTLPIAIDPHAVC